MATPIGNLSDITLRALEILKSVDAVVCEDTRVTGKLLSHFEIKKPLISFFQHSQLSKIDYIHNELSAGKNLALVTDAGTPGISDPGQALIHRIQNTDNRIQFVPIPGASALAAIASVSGMIEKEFYFAGFLPKKKGRQTKFKMLQTLDCPIVIYESANRLEKLLGEIELYLGGDVEVVVGREMTKMFEEYWGGNVSDLILDLKSHQLKGEVALIVSQSVSRKSRV